MPYYKGTVKEYMSRIKGNFEKPGLVNPSVPAKPKPIYGAVYVPKQGRLTLFKTRIKIVRRGWGHTYWNYKGKDMCPVHYDNRHECWVISTK